MKLTWKSFREDRTFLTKYFMLRVLLLAGAVYLLKDEAIYQLNLSWVHLSLLPIAIIAGIQIPVLMHNCMHGNLKSKFINELLGELTALFALMNLSILRINHTLHHAYADTHDDPHDPAHKNFLTYLFVSQLTGARIIESKFLEYHGKTRSNVVLFKFNIFIHYTGHLLRLWLWFLVFGPEMFVSFYIPAFIVYSLAFAHVNYITHTRDQNGKVEIINKDDNLYYNFINLIGSGVYYHKNHHHYPKLMNPMRLRKARVL